MSRESEAIFAQALRGYATDGNAQSLQTAAQGHLGASRPLDELLAEYATAMEDQKSHTPAEAARAQAIADELEYVRTAARVAAGHLPSTGG